MDYELAIEAANKPMVALEAAISADLDPEEGGIGWWNDQIGWRYSALIGDYLLSACSGVCASLADASVAIEKHAETEFSDNHWVRDGFARAATSGRGLAELARGAKERERVRLLGLYRERSLGSLATTLDRLAAIAAGVAGVKIDLLTIGWASLRRLIDAERQRLELGKAVKKPLRMPFCDLGTAGRERQDALFDVVFGWQDFGPTDWLPWLLQARHTDTHRAPLSEWMVVFGTRDFPRGEGWTRPFWRQPAWSDTESWIKFGSLKEVDGLLIVEHPNDVLRGLRESTVQLTKAIGEAALELWLARRADPALIVQDGGAWAEIAKAEPLAFSGYGGPKLKVVGKELHISPEGGRRLRATKVMHADRGKWTSSS